MTFFLTPDVASKNTLPMLRDDRLQSSPPRVLFGLKCSLSSLVGSSQLLQHPIAIPKLCFRRLFEGPPQHCGISRADKPRPSIHAEID